MDFVEKVNEIKERNPKKKEIPLVTLFSENWNIYADKLVKEFEKSSKKEVTYFLLNYKDLCKLV